MEYNPDKQSKKRNKAHIASLFENVKWNPSPSNSNRVRTILPISALDQRHLPLQIGARSIEDLVGVAVSAQRIVGMRVFETAVVRVRVRRHCVQYLIEARFPIVQLGR